MQNKIITLATLHEAADQEVFDQIARHLLTQKVKAMEYGNCVYLTKEGLKCAAGCLIGPEEIENIQNSDWLALSNLNKVPNKHIGLIYSLQRIHDLTNVCDWKGLLHSFAKLENLSWNPEFDSL